MIYILEFKRPFHHARYYMGYCNDGRFSERLTEHYLGRGAAITRAALARGIGFRVVMTMPGTRADERRLKRQKNTPRIVRKLQEKGHESAFGTTSEKL